MTPHHPRSIGPGVRAAIGGADLEPVGRADDDGVALLRPTADGPDVAVLHHDGPDSTALSDEADRLRWLAGGAPVPEMLASGRADDGAEALAITLGADATSAADGHPMGPEALLHALAAALDMLHRRPTAECPLVADTPSLRRVVDRRVGAGLVEVAVDGPYAGRTPEELVAVFDDLMAQLGEPGEPVFVHAALTPERIWLDPAGHVTFLGWRCSGVGDRHIDLAAAAAMLTSLHGPALVAPFFEAYGFDRVDVRRLDAHQLLAHLLA